MDIILIDSCRVVGNEIDAADLLKDLIDIGQYLHRFSNPPHIIDEELLIYRPMKMSILGHRE